MLMLNDLVSAIGRMYSLKSVNQANCLLHFGIQLTGIRGMDLGTILLTVIGYHWIFPRAVHR